MATFREVIKTAIDKQASDLPSKRKKELEEAMFEMYTEGKLPKDVMGYTPQMMEILYNYGYQMFKSGKYKDALAFFRFLFLKDPSSYRYCFQIAACYQYLQDYDNASAYYRIASGIDPQNPVPEFHLYGCWMHLNAPKAAQEALVRTIFLCGEHEKYKALKERATLEFYKLDDEIRKTSSSKKE